MSIDHKKNGVHIQRSTPIVLPSSNIF